MHELFHVGEAVKNVSALNSRVACCRVVDFGPGTDVKEAFRVQKTVNPSGLSPPLCSEF